MGLRDSTARSADATSREEDRHYRAICSTLSSMTPDEVAYQLPNLVDTMDRLAEDHDDTRRFLVGVSFAKDYTPLDYSLERVVEPNDGDRDVESVKDAVSGDHFYLRFGYPPDPNFDAHALRGALLAAADRERRDRATERKSRDTGVSGLWKHLAGGSE